LQSTIEQLYRRPSQVMERACWVHETLPVHEIVMTLLPQRQSFETWQVERKIGAPPGTAGVRLVGLTGELIAGTATAKPGAPASNNNPNRVSVLFICSLLSGSR
jgi:hypothetical protein